jgi:hypothetical protein
VNRNDHHAGQVSTLHEDVQSTPAITVDVRAGPQRPLYSHIVITDARMEQPLLGQERRRFFCFAHPLAAEKKKGRGEFCEALRKKKNWKVVSTGDRYFSRMLYEYLPINTQFICFLTLNNRPQTF